MREIIAEYGPDALSESGTISNLVKDLLPDDQQIARILIVAFGVLAAAAGGVILVNRHDPTVPAPSAGATLTPAQSASGGPQASGPPPGSYPVHRQFFDNGSVVLTLTTINVRQHVLTVLVTYRDTTPIPEVLSCSGFGVRI